MAFKGGYRYVWQEILPEASHKMVVFFFRLKWSLQNIFISQHTTTKTVFCNKLTSQVNKSYNMIVGHFNATTSLGRKMGIKLFFWLEAFERRFFLMSFCCWSCWRYHLIIDIVDDDDVLSAVLFPTDQSSIYAYA